MTVNELLGKMGGFHNDGKTGLEVRVFVTDETLQAGDVERAAGVPIKKIYLDEEAYPKAGVVIEI